MSLRDDRTALLHMLENAEEALSLVAGRSQKDIESDRVLSLALVRLLEVIGEAANRVSAELKEDSPQIPWAQIVGLRNRLIHAYDSIDIDILLADSVRRSSVAGCSPAGAGRSRPVMPPFDGLRMA